MAFPRHPGFLGVLLDVRCLDLRSRARLWTLFERHVLAFDCPKSADGVPMLQAWGGYIPPEFRSVPAYFLPIGTNPGFIQSEISEAAATASASQGLKADGCQEGEIADDAAKAPEKS